MNTNPTRKSIAAARDNLDRRYNSELSEYGCLAGAMEEIFDSYEALLTEREAEIAALQAEIARMKAATSKP